MHVFIHSQCVARTVFIFYFSLVRAALLGAARQGAPPPVSFLPRLTQSDSVHYFFVLQGVSQHLGYLLALTSQPCPIWTITWRIRSVLEGPFEALCFGPFRRGSQSGQRLFITVPAWAGLSILSNILGDFRSCCRVFDHLTAHLAALISGGSWLSLSFLQLQGIQNSRRECFTTSQGICSLTSLSYDGEGLDRLLDCTKGSQLSCGFSKGLGRADLWLWETSREVCTFPYVLLVSLQRRYQWSVSFLPDGIFSLAVFPHVLWWGEDKI